jgi:hypothetical protein
MKIVHFDKDNWAKDHPSGSISFQHLLTLGLSAPSSSLELFLIGLPPVVLPETERSL